MSIAANNCRWCGSIHVGDACPAVKVIEYYPDGVVKRVEFQDAKPLADAWPPRPLEAQIKRDPLSVTCLGLFGKQLVYAPHRFS